MEIKKSNLNFGALARRKETTEIIIHCSATKEGSNVSVKAIHNMHKGKGWSGIGYHYYIDINGNVWGGRPEWAVGAHTPNHNDFSIGICYCGGLSKNGAFKDTRTPGQHYSMRNIVGELLAKYPNAKVLGHRDTSPDKNGNGVIEPSEWIKGCPCFDVRTWMKEMGWEEHSI